MSSSNINGNTPSEEQRFAENINGLIQLVYEIIKDISGKGYQLVNPELVKLAGALISKFDPKVVLDAFINYSHEHWDQIKERNRQFFVDHADQIFRDLPIGDNLQTFKKLFALKDPSGSYVVDGDDLDCMWDFFDGNVKIAVKYIHREREKLVSDLDTVLEDNLGRSLFVQARNLKFHDLVWGGIVGNKDYVYSAMIKADGLRKLFVIHNSGLWIVYPPNEFALISRVSMKNALITVFDGESIPLENRRSNAPRTNYYYIAFDCIVFQGNKSIQIKNHRNRLQAAETFTKKMAPKLTSPELLFFGYKESWTLDSVENFFKNMRIIFEQMSVAPYENDGIIFTPENAPYLPIPFQKLMLLPLHKRSLTTYPDVVKWKPPSKLTFDNIFNWINGNNGISAELLTSRKKRIGRGFELVPFKGSKYVPFNGEINFDNPHLTKLRSGRVVEFGMNFETNLLEAHRVREDKRFPNTEEVTLDVWSDINNPITADTIKGENFTLLYKYNNRIKRELFNAIPAGKRGIDIGSGIGGDISKMTKFSKLLLVEPDKEKIPELQRRIELNNMQDKVRVINTGGEDVETISREAQLWLGGPADFISMMLSLSFFWYSEAMLDRLAATIANNLKIGGSLIFFTIDGTFVKQLFKPEFGGITQRQLKIGPATINYDPNQIRIPGYGEELHIHIEDTIVSDQNEYLVYLDDLYSRLEKLGFSEKLDFFKRADKEKFLTEAERLFSSMYSYGKLDRLTFKQIDIRSLPPLVPRPILIVPPKPEDLDVRTSPNKQEDKGGGTIDGSRSGRLSFEGSKVKEEATNGSTEILRGRSTLLFGSIVVTCDGRSAELVAIGRSLGSIIASCLTFINKARHFLMSSCSEAFVAIASVYTSSCNTANKSLVGVSFNFSNSSRVQISLSRNSFKINSRSEDISLINFSLISGSKCRLKVIVPIINKAILVSLGRALNSSSDKLG